jgi:hypothetical protein
MFLCFWVSEQALTRGPCPQALGVLVLVVVLMAGIISLALVQTRAGYRRAPPGGPALILPTFSVVSVAALPLPVECWHEHGSWSAWRSGLLGPRPTCHYLHQKRSDSIADEPPALNLGVTGSLCLYRAA